MAALGSAWPSALGGIATAVACAFVLRDGIVLTPDGWEYWEGSISLLHGRGYRYYGDAPIIFYPPLFSLFLAAVQGIFGESARTLIAATSLLGGVTTAIWVRLAQRLSAPNTSSAPLLALAAFCVPFVAFSFVALLSETVFLCFVGSALLCVASLVRCEEAERHDIQRETWVVIAGVALLATAAALTRNAGLAFVPGLAIVVGLRLHGVPLAKRAMAVLMVGAVPALAWLFVRFYFEQGASHPARLPAWGSAIAYLRELSHGVPELLDGHAGVLGVGLALFVVAGLASTVGADFVEGSERARGAARDVSIVAASGVVGLIVLMSSVSVGDPLAGRFLWFFVLTLVALLCASTSWLEARGHAAILLGVVVVATGAQALRHDALPYHFPTRVTPQQTMSIEAARRARDEGEALELIVPPVYPWIVERRGFVLDHELE